METIYRFLHTVIQQKIKEGASPEVPVVPTPMNFHKQAAMNLFSKQAWNVKGFFVVLSAVTTPILQALAC